MSTRFGLQLKLDARYLGGLCEREGEETTNDGWWLRYLAIMMAGCTLWWAAEGDDRFGQSNRKGALLGMHGTTGSEAQVLLSRGFRAPRCLRGARGGRTLGHLYAILFYDDEAVYGITRRR